MPTQEVGGETLRRVATGRKSHRDVCLVPIYTLPTVPQGGHGMPHQKGRVCGHRFGVIACSS